MKRENSKHRIFALCRLLMDQSDLSHPLSMPTLISTLESQGYPCERKAIYDDFKVLESIGLEIQFVRTPSMGYVLSGRIFESVELKLLIDAVSASSFLSEKKTQQLKDKLLQFSTVYEKDSLFMDIDYPKSSNEQIFYTIDTLLQAIREKKKIQFTYFDLGLDKKRHYRKQKKTYQGDPYGLVWENKSYYVLMKMDHHEDISQYRADKMDQVICTDIIYESKPFNLQQYRSQRINMYSGEKVSMTLEFENSDRLASLVLDQFGEDILILAQNEKTFTVNVKSSISPTLMGWLATLGTQVKIIQPESLISAYQNHLNKILNQYREVHHESD